jgi:hypothetical protein
MDPSSSQTYTKTTRMFSSFHPNSHDGSKCLVVMGQQSEIVGVTIPPLSTVTSPNTTPARSPPSR